MTIIVPTLGARSGLLARALSSALATDAREVLLIDDGTPDGSVREVAQHFHNVRYLRRSRNGGVAAAQNSGVTQASGAFICFLHSDDLIRAGCLHAQVKLLETGADVAGGSVLTNGELDPDPMPSAQPADLLHFRFGTHISPYLFQREVLRQFGFDERLRGWEDWDLLFRLKLANLQFAAVDEVVAEITGDAPTRLSTSGAIGDNLIYLWTKYQDLLTDRRLRARWQFKIGRNLLHSGRRREGRRWVARSLVAEPWHPRRATFLVSSRARPTSET